MATLEATFTPQEAAAVLKTHYQTVLKLIKENQLPAARIGRSYVIRESAIANLLAESENGKRQATRRTRSDQKWPSTSAKTESGMPTFNTATSELDDLCARLTRQPRKKSTTK